MVKKLDIFDDYNKGDSIKIVFDATIDSTKGSYTKDGSVFGIYTNEYDAKHNAYVYLDFRGWFDTNGVFIKPSSLVVTLKNTSGAYIKNAFSKIIFDENGFATSRIKSDYFVFDPVDNTLDFNTDTVFSKYWLTSKKVANDFFKKFKDTYGVKVEGLEDFVDDNIANTGLDVHITKTNDGLKSNYDGSHKIGGSGGSGGAIVTDIQYTDYLIGLENNTLEDSFYNVIEEGIYKTSKMNSFISYQGLRGVFQTDNKVYLCNGFNSVSIDKATDVLNVVDTTPSFTLATNSNRCVCETDDYFVVYLIGAPGYLLVVNKTTDVVTKVPLSLTLTSQPIYFQTKDGYNSRMFPDQMNPALTDGSIIWGLSNYNGAGSNIYCIYDILNGLIEASTGVNYFFFNGAICAPNGALYVPYKTATSNPVTSIRKYRYVSGILYDTINLTGNYGLSYNTMNPIIHNGLIIYPVYDTTNVNNLSFMIIDTNSGDNVQYIPVATMSNPITSGNYLTLYKDDLKERLYFTYYYSGTTGIKMGYIDLNNPTVVNISSFNITAQYYVYNPVTMKRLDNDTIGLQVFTGYTTYTMNIVKDDLSNIITSDTYNALSYPQNGALEIPNYFDSDDNYVYVKPYNNTNLIKVDKTTGNVQSIPLIKKASYEDSYKGESIHVIGNDNVLVIPGWQYKDNIVYSMIDDTSLTQGKAQHSTNSVTGVLPIIANDKIYTTATYMPTYGIYSDVFLERLIIKDSSKFTLVKNGEQIPYMN